MSMGGIAYPDKDYRAAREQYEVANWTPPPGMDGYLRGFGAPEGYEPTAPEMLRAATWLKESGMTPEIMEQRRQFDVARQLLDPYVGMGAASLGQIRGTDTAGGLDARLGQIFGSNAFQQLADQRTRAVKHELNQSGMSRSDSALRALADVPLEVGFGIEEQLYGRSMNQAGNAQNAAAGLGSLGAQNANSISEIMMQNQANRTAERNMEKQRNAAMVQQGAQLGATAYLAYLAFSDLRLKANVCVIGRLGPLNWCRWDWIPGAPESGEGEGVIAQEVMALFPDYVHPIGHFLAVDYAGLMAAVNQRAPLVEVAA